MIIDVKKINNVGRFGEYPALKNIKTGCIYVDVTLANPRYLAHDANGENAHGLFVGYNILGAWHSFNQEPECPLRKDITFNLNHFNP